MHITFHSSNVRMNHIIDFQKHNINYIMVQQSCLLQIGIITIVQLKVNLYKSKLNTYIHIHVHRLLLRNDFVSIMQIHAKIYICKNLQHVTTKS